MPSQMKKRHNLEVEYDDMLEHLSANRYPTMVQHCILKVMKQVPGNNKAKFHGACNICLWVFRKHGYMAPHSLARTGKGMKRNRKHQREKEASRKRNMYKQVVEKIFRKEIDELKLRKLED